MGTSETEYAQAAWAARTPPDPADLWAWADSSLDAAHAAIRAAGTPSGAVDIAVAHLASVRADPERQNAGTDTLGDELVAALPELGRRCRLLGRDDPAGAADLLALTGSALIKRAWQVRGSGAASTVGRDAFAEFHRILGQADEVLGEALQANPEHSGAGVSRMWCAMGLGASQEEWWERFAVARRAKPTLFAANSTMVTALCPKWYGSNEAMLGFARKVVEAAPSGDPVTAVLPWAYAEYVCALLMRATSWQLARRPWRATLRQGRAEVAAADSSWLAAADPLRGQAHPASCLAHHNFAWFHQRTGNAERARWHIAQCAGRQERTPWEITYSPVLAERRYRKLQPKQPSAAG